MDRIMVSGLAVTEAAYTRFSPDTRHGRHLGAAAGVEWYPNLNVERQIDIDAGAG
jgi:hypothetical protein